MANNFMTVSVNGEDVLMTQYEFEDILGRSEARKMQEADRKALEHSLNNYLAKYGSITIGSINVFNEGTEPEPVTFSDFLTIITVK